jgi:hypothetical protein
MHIPYQREERIMNTHQGKKGRSYIHKKNKSVTKLPEELSQGDMRKNSNRLVERGEN